MAKTKKTAKDIGFDFNSVDIRKAMKALNTKDCKHATVVLVAKQMGFDIAGKTPAIRSLCGRMIRLKNTDE